MPKVKFRYRMDAEELPLSMRVRTAFPQSKSGTFSASDEQGRKCCEPICAHAKEGSADTADAESRAAEYAIRRGWTVAMQVREVSPALSNGKLANN